MRHLDEKEEMTGDAQIPALTMGPNDGPTTRLSESSILNILLKSSQVYFVCLLQGEQPFYIKSNVRPSITASNIYSTHSNGAFTEMFARAHTHIPTFNTHRVPIDEPMGARHTH